MTHTTRAAALTLALAALPAPSLAAGGEVSLSGSLGMAWLQADEYVYNPDGSKLSHLIWEAEAVPVASFEASWRAEARWTLLGSLSVGLPRTGYMEDYDWLDPERDWTHRSRHPDTPLDHYVAFDVGARYDLLRRDDWSVGLLGGLRYSDVKWTAYGGDYVYSSAGGYRDIVGDFPDGEKGISYRQQLPALYLGPAGELEAWGLELSGSVVGGVGFAARGLDDHWMRDLHFEDDFDPAPFLGVRARAAWPLGPDAALFLATRWERHFPTGATTTTTDTATGERFFDGGDAAGGAFEALTLDAGVRVKF